MFRSVSLSHRKHAPLLAGFFVAVVSVFGIVSLAPGTAHAADCDDNAIIKCGFSSKSDFISTVRSNKSGNGHHDLPAIYSSYGLAPADYDRFVSSARPGTAYKDGRIVVDGQVVATGARSIGRLASYQGSGYFSQNIGGNTYYGNTNSKAFASSSIPVMVLFNSKGAMEFAVLSSCGNPESGTVVHPSYTCNALHKSAVSGKANTYNFSTSASAANNAVVTQLVYNYGDGTTAVTHAPGTVVQHTFTKPGTYTIRVRVYVSLPGNQSDTVVSTNCETTITVAAPPTPKPTPTPTPTPPPSKPLPYYSCVQLTGTAIDQAKMSFQFTATAASGNGATFTGADFDFGDGTKQNGIAANGATATVSHTYAAGTYNASALLHFSVNGSSATAPTCKALVTPTAPPTPECKPGVPVGDTSCNPCPTNPSVSADDTTACVAAQTELPNTGAGNTIAIFAVVVIGGFLVYRQIIFRKHKAAFMAAEQGTSALPLGQPLDSNAPLAGTPLAAKRRSFRRRQF